MGSNITFSGPIFIIGIPRSGTKLLRGLLINHPNIGIPSIETEFLPYWVRNWNKFGNLPQWSIFKKFYKTVIKFPYFIYMRENGKLIQDKTWFELCERYTPAGIFEALMRHDAKVRFGTAKIWGDKSPSYIGHLPLLKNLFPEARFIHIIRDVRDYCLSINKAYGKNMIRAAQRWVDSIQKARLDSKKFPRDYLEVRYEDLLDIPEITMKKVCNFLSQEFHIQMLHFSTSTEDRGDAKGKREIVRDNRGKYLNLMKPSIRNKIETIAAPVLKACGYLVDYSGDNKSVSRSQMLCYQLLDGLNLIKLGMKRRGLFGSLKSNLKYFIISGNRQK